MAVTKKVLELKVYLLNSSLKRPVSQFANKPDEPTVFSAGHIYLDKNAGGYSLEMQNAGGGVTVLCPRRTAKEMAMTIEAMLVGAVLVSEK